MGVLQLIAILILIGVALWAVNYLLKSYCEPWILALVNKIAVVGVVLLIVLWLLSMLGIIGPIQWWVGPAPRW